MFVAQILYSVDLIQMSRSTQTAVYIWCDDDTAFTYLNYLSIASVMRFYRPNQMMIFYETRPPSISGNWIQLSSTSSSSDVDQLAALMSRCHLTFQGPTKMKNGTMVCRSRRQKQSAAGGNVQRQQQSDGGKFFNEFITRLLLQYGGLYVGRSTFMTEVATYFRLVGAVNEHMLSFHSYTEVGEGFVFVREPVVDRPPAASERPPGDVLAPVAGATTTSRPEGAPPGVEVRYYKSREIGCYEGRNFSTDALKLSVDQKVSLYACAVMPGGPPELNPQEVLTLKSDFGRAARKALFNIHDDWETKYYLKAVNGSAVPPLCYF
jgi:hypothetical protein